MPLHPDDATDLQRQWDAVSERLSAMVEAGEQDGPEWDELCRRQDEIQYVFALGDAEAGPLRRPAEADPTALSK